MRGWGSSLLFDEALTGVLCALPRTDTNSGIAKSNMNFFIRPPIVSCALGRFEEIE
jgi:hypothetical protein